MFRNNKRVLPNFLCIGVTRGGTSWLYKMLRSHGDVYLCPYKKETFFFYKHYNKGLEWYKQFFPTKDEAEKYEAIGEIAATYLSKTQTSKLISNNLPNVRLIIILRNPVDRSFSSYQYKKSRRFSIKSFESYFERYKNGEDLYTFNSGFYYEQINHWLEFFPRDQFLILIFEDLMDNPLAGLKKISNFLNIDYKKFNFNLIGKKVNPSITPQSHRLFVFSYKIYKFINSLGLYRITKLLSNFKPFLHKFGKKDKEKEGIPPQLEDELYKLYENDIAKLEELLERDLSIWKK